MQGVRQNAGEALESVAGVEDSRRKGLLQTPRQLSGRFAVASAGPLGLSFAVRAGRRFAYHEALEEDCQGRERQGCEQTSEHVSRYRPATRVSNTRWFRLLVIKQWERRILHL